VVDASGKGNFTSLDALNSTTVKPGDVVYMRGMSCTGDPRPHCKLQITFFTFLITGTFTTVQTLQNINVRCFLSGGCAHL
jgi:phosphoribosyl 1,2-cyclic phosphodiesterase